MRHIFPLVTLMAYSVNFLLSTADIDIGRGGWVSVLFIYIVIKLVHFFISASTGVAAPGCNGTVNAAV